MTFKLKWLEEDMTGYSSKPTGPRLLTVTEFQIPQGAPCHLQPTLKPRRRTETVSQKCDTHYASECVSAFWFFSTGQHIIMSTIYSCYNYRCHASDEYSKNKNDLKVTCSEVHCNLPQCLNTGFAITIKFLLLSDFTALHQG